MPPLTTFSSSTASPTAMHDTPSNKPTVLIIGAGLGGLLLGALLEKAGVPYQIFEKTATVRPLGSALSVGPLVLPILQQLGIYEEFLSISKYLTHIVMHNEALKPYKPSDYRPVEEFTGYGFYIVARPLLHDLFLRQVPADKIHFGKRVLVISEKDDKVTIHTTDGNAYSGDILVGADGAHSTVREQLYESLKVKGELPKSDQEDLPFSCTCLVGQTKTVDSEDFPVMKEEVCKFLVVIGDRPYTWIIFTTAQNTLCWMVIHHLNKKTSKAALGQGRAGTSETIDWGSQAALAMCDETRAFPIPIGDGSMTLGDLYDRTPKDLISKVMLEEKVFKTWHFGRTVLMGDACHKLHPSGGHGAVTAMHDAIALANHFYALPSTSSEDVTQIFEEYHAERYPAIMESFKNSQQGSRVLEKGIAGSITLFISTHAPLWVWRAFLVKTLKHRPQSGFLPPIPLKGTVAPAVSPSCEKAR
ncbi:hypothetical protein BGX23_010233, partial [Mortierella sp. AD031]